MRNVRVCVCVHVHDHDHDHVPGQCSQMLVACLLRAYMMTHFALLFPITCQAFCSGGLKWQGLNGHYDRIQPTL